jgi:hypothetical protein
MGEARKIAAMLVTQVIGYSRPAGGDIVEFRSVIDAVRSAIEAPQRKAVGSSTTPTRPPLTFSRKTPARTIG